MGSTYIFLFSIFAILAIASILTLFYNLKRQKELTNSILSEKDQIKIAFDLCRKEKMDADDKLNLIQAQEKTYKVAYEDWKAKYEMLENRFILLKKELEAKPLPVAPQIFSEPKSTTDIPQSDVHHEFIEKDAPSETSIVQELQLILDQHLEIISSLIGDEKMEAINKKIKPADPLHWIMGIDEDVSKRLQNQGIKTFTQISSLPKKEIRKLMDQFEEIEEKVIESWPLQASAILNTQEHK
ncbi:MAG: hypothetical protein JNK69_06495 [Saprospiraceae bacterium]|nr:hypothetical protein [Candidatus Vicinibacter proximus]MBL7823039.1 hypothetical protein [Saprospiraceae bacterium]MCC6842219.1 hypothetical protein [Saprospiraceae bacterium]HRG33398.1 hypothetical protein [Saprospiraceae bacterium]